MNANNATPISVIPTTALNIEPQLTLLNDLKNSYGEAINHKVGMRDMILQSSTTFPAYLKDQQKFYDDMKSKGYS